MRCVIFTHSLVSDWNHGNAHFLRGIATELMARGHDVRIFEPASSWSRSNLLADQGIQAIREFEQTYPRLRSIFYEELDVSNALNGADLVIVHEWNQHSLVEAIGRHHIKHDHYVLFFHDTHHRSVTEPHSMGAYDLGGYNGVLAYGNVIRDRYLRQGWARNAWTWHEAADTRVFYPRANSAKEGDLVWIGNWGDDERTEELQHFLIQPVKQLGLKARVYGVRYPPHALQALDAAGIEYGGWLPNYRVPEVFSRFKMTVHVPRRPYASALPGIPTIRPFEALACGIPLISAPWNDSEHLFRAGDDFLTVRTSADMISTMRTVLSDNRLSESLARHGLETIRARHTCAHRVDELLALAANLAETAIAETMEVK